MPTTLVKKSSKSPPYWKILAGNLLFGGFVLLMCSSSIMLANFSVLVVLGVLLPMAVSARKGTYELRRQRWTRFTIYAVAVSAGWLLDHQANDTELKNFNSVIAAVEQYHTNENRYPDTLEQLVPKYLSVVPAGRWGKFLFYAGDTGNVSLMHLPMPYLHESYYFNSRTRKTWD